MSRTRSSYIPLGVVTRGLGSVDPSGGMGRASRGLIHDFPEGIEPPPDETSPERLLSTIAFDGNGTQRLLSDDIVSLHFAHAGQELFSNPDREYTGYAANGFWYDEGVLDPTHIPFKATWASEGEGDPGENRSDLDRMPRRLIIAATRKEVALFDADTLNLWMRFLIGVVLPPSVPGPDPNLGTLAGQPTTLIRSARYANGYLVIATNEGLRVADFRRDRGFLLGATTSHGGSGGLEDRNSDTFLSGTAYSVPALLIQNDDCLSMDIGAISANRVYPGTTKRSRTISAVGHPDGITAIQLDYPSAVGITVARHPAELVVGNGWEVEEDGDLDSTSPYFVDDNYDSTLWEGLGAKKGDLLELDTEDDRLISEVDQLQPGRRLVVTPELPVSATGSSYRISREVGAVMISPDMHLYFANGVTGIGVVRDQSWVFTPDFIFNYLLVAGNNYSDFSAAVGSVNALAKRGDVVYAATSRGVFTTTDDDLDTRKVAPFTYATEAVTDVETRYRILFGDEENCQDISVDPETGNVMVAVTDYESVVTEINPNIEQAFRYFDNVGRVKALVSYRNPEGPPDEDPEEAS